MSSSANLKQKGLAANQIVNVILAGGQTRENTIQQQRDIRESAPTQRF